MPAMEKVGSAYCRKNKTKQNKTKQNKTKNRGPGTGEKY